MSPTQPPPDQCTQRYELSVFFYYKQWTNKGLWRWKRVYKHVGFNFLNRQQKFLFTFPSVKYATTQSYECVVCRREWECVSVLCPNILSDNEQPDHCQLLSFWFFLSSPSSSFFSTNFSLPFFFSFPHLLGTSSFFSFFSPPLSFYFSAFLISRISPLPLLNIVRLQKVWNKVH